MSDLCTMHAAQQGSGYDFTHLVTGWRLDVPYPGQGFAPNYEHANILRQYAKSNR